MTPLNRMQSLRAVDTFHTRITYAAAVSASSLNPAAFDTLPNNVITSLITQIGSREVEVTWDDPSGGETSVRYQGTTPGILTPQTLNF